jgi:hypothetical protein
VAALGFWRSSGSVRSGCARGALRNRTNGRHVQGGVDDEDAQALRAEGFDPDDPAVIAVIELVSACGAALLEICTDLIPPGKIGKIAALVGTVAVLALVQGAWVWKRRRERTA